MAVAFGGLGGRRRERRPPQPGGDAGVRGAAQVRLGEGPALLGRPGHSARSSAPRWCSSSTSTRSTQFNLAARTPKSGGAALATYSIFATFPAGYFHGGYAGPLIDQIVGTAFLLIFVVALIDLRNTAVGSNLAPLAIGLAVAAIGMSYGAERGLRDQPGP